MTEKELKKLNRQELLEVLLAQSKRIDRLQNQLRETEEKLSERELVISEAGSIAEASLSLNNVFSAAQKAADQYLDNIRRLHEQAEREYADMGRQCAEDNREEAERLLRMKEQTEKECAEIKEQAEREYAEIKEQAARLKEQAERKCSEITEQAARLKEQAERECSDMRAQAQKECSEMKLRADKQIRHGLIRTKKAIRNMLTLYATEVEKRMRRLQRWDRQTGAMHERKIEKRSS